MCSALVTRIMCSTSETNIMCSAEATSILGLVQVMVESVGVEEETDALKNPVICAPLCAGDESVGVEDETDALKDPVTDVLRCVQVRLKHQSHSHGVPAL